MYEVRGNYVFDTYGTRVFEVRGNYVFDTYGTRKYEIRGERVYDTYGNWLGSDYSKSMEMENNI